MDFSDHKTKIFALLVTVVLSIFFLILDSIGAVNSLYAMFDSLTLPSRLKFKEVSEAINDYLGAFSKFNELRNENLSIQEENSKLLETIAALKGIEEENKSLKEQLEIREISDFSLQEARVIAVDNALTNTIQINVGSSKGVEGKDVVVYGKHAIGEITEVRETTSLVLLITSPSSNIPAFGMQNNAKGLVKGFVGSQLELLEILPDEKLDIGEIVVTTGVNSNYPANFILGTVSQIDEDKAKATRKATLETKIDFSNLKYVYVIKGQAL